MPAESLKENRAQGHGTIVANRQSVINLYHPSTCNRDQFKANVQI